MDHILQPCRRMLRHARRPPESPRSWRFSRLPDRNRSSSRCSQGQGLKLRARSYLVFVSAFSILLSITLMVVRLSGARQQPRAHGGDNAAIDEKVAAGHKARIRSEKI